MARQARGDGESMHVPFLVKLAAKTKDLDKAGCSDWLLKDGSVDAKALSDLCRGASTGIVAL